MCVWFGRISFSVFGAWQIVQCKEKKYFPYWEWVSSSKYVEVDFSLQNTPA